MKKSIRVLAAVVAVILFFDGLANNVNVSAASVSSDTKNIEKVLKYYKKGQYKKAQKYNKKLAVSLHDEVNLDIETIKGNLYLIENSDAIGLSNIEDYKKYKDILINNISR